MRRDDMLAIFYVVVATALAITCALTGAYAHHDVPRPAAHAEK